ncbi:MAG: pilin [Patescibacteria group bacterium]
MHFRRRYMQHTSIFFFMVFVFLWLVAGASAAQTAGICIFDSNVAEGGRGCVDNKASLEGHIWEIRRSDVASAGAYKDDASCRALCRGSGEFSLCEFHSFEEVIETDQDGKKSCCDWDFFNNCETPVVQPAPVLPPEDLGLIPDTRPLNQFKNASTTLPQLIGRGLSVAIGIIGTIALVMFVYGGGLWMFAAGNSDREKRALLTMLWTGLGIVVILSSYALAKFVLRTFV